MAQIEAIIFDMDGVLIDAREWHYEALNRALGLFGYTISRFDHLVTYDGLPTRKKLEMLTLERGLPARLHGFINELKQIYTVEMIHTRCRPVFAHEYALSKLHAQGFRLAVASNSIRETVELMMRKSALAPYLEFVLSNQDVARAKPDPEMYLQAIARLNLRADQCLVVEDNPNGIKAAQAAGAHVMEVRGVEDMTYDAVLANVSRAAEGSGGVKILIPMGGPETAFEQAGHRHGKWLTEIHGRPLIQHVFDNLESAGAAGFIFVIRKEDDVRFHLADVLRLMAPGCGVIMADGPTAGAACTALLAIELINPEEELVIANGDQIMLADLPSILGEFRERKLDAGTIVFDSIHPRWSYIRINPQNGLVVEATEKRPISRLATAGIYYFRRGADFCDAATGMIRKGAHVNDAYYICPCLNEMILRQCRIGAHHISGGHYFSLSTPQGVERYAQSEQARPAPAAAAPLRVPTREMLEAVAARRIPPRETRPAHA